MHDLVTGFTMRVSVDSGGAECAGDSRVSGASADGRSIAIDSFAPDLVSSDTNGAVDCFVHEPCGTAASWANYGVGLPGTQGVPAFTARQIPTLGAALTVDLANSYGAPTLGMLVLGFQRASLPTRFGGDLLVAPALILPITISSGGDSFSGTVSPDPAFCGVTVDLQGIESDPGAAYGYSFSSGLELVIGL